MKPARSTLRLFTVWAPWLGLALGFRALGADMAAATTPSVGLSSPRMQADGSFEFSIDGLAGRSGQVSVSGNLVDWSLLTNVSAEVGALVVADAQAAQHSRRFYRVAPPITVRS